MPENSIIALIGKSIREGRYLSITYKNNNGDVTPFWISIWDINANNELQVNMFNVTKDEPILKAKIFISKIQSAEMLKFSHYDVPEELINKLYRDESLHKYEFDNFDSRLLNYYLECYRANKDPFLHKQHLIPGLDLQKLRENNPFQLNDSQQKRIINEIYNNDYNKYYNYELVLNDFSIDLESRGKFVVAYRKLTFDPVAKTLIVSEKVYFNATFFIQGIKLSLSYYSDISPIDFEDSYINNRNDAIEKLINSFNTGEVPNSRPEIVVLGHAQIDISKVYEDLDADHTIGNMEVPMKAFFQNMSSLDTKNRTKPNIVLYDHRVNIHQLRSIYNAHKFPITYVQGPPGTGKTQTILNIAINGFTSNKTILITSNNNIPIDGIYDKLALGNYKNKKILFPVLRLGNNYYVSQALIKIKELYEFETNDIPKEELLTRIKEKSKQNNKLLDDYLESLEQKIELEQNLVFIDKLISKGSTYLLEVEKNKIENKLNELPELTEEELKEKFEVIKGNHSLLQFFYFESLKQIKRLKSKEFGDLIAILKISKEDEQVKEFNKWVADDKNLEKLTKVFPIILATNLSSRKLGKKFKFDLMVMDEAGQCDIATSLIPIAKCKNMVLIGDTNQLRPIVVFDEAQNKQLMKQFSIQDSYNYFNNSILSVFKRIDNISRDILLSYHYRCGKKIINYSNMRFYENKLNLTGIIKPGSVKLLDVKNLNHKNKNSQIEEAITIINYIQDHNLKEVFILTPFRNQEELINYYLNEAIRNGKIDSTVQCGTIHKVQGQENKTIIISTAISRSTSQRTYDWIKNNSQLINVGVTRAQENLIVVTDRKAIDILSRKDDDLYALIEYVEKNGMTEIPQSFANKFTIGFSNDSNFENEFYKTMQHYCSVQNGRFERNVKITHLFPEEASNDLVNKKEFDGVLFLGNIPHIVFEINGLEHKTRSKTIKSDLIKKELLAKKNIQLIMIPNQYVKHYEFIRELIGKLHGNIYHKTLFDIYE